MAQYGGPRNRGNFSDEPEPPMSHETVAQSVGMKSLGMLMTVFCAGMLGALLVGLHFCINKPVNKSEGFFSHIPDSIRTRK